jgi:hypothetical protein
MYICSDGIVNVQYLYISCIENIPCIRNILCIRYLHSWYVLYTWFIPYTWYIPYSWHIPYLWYIPYLLYTPYLWNIPYSWYTPYSWCTLVHGTFKSYWEVSKDLTEYNFISICSEKNPFVFHAMNNLDDFCTIHAYRFYYVDFFKDLLKLNFFNEILTKYQQIKTGQIIGQIIGLIKIINNVFVLFLVLLLLFGHILLAFCFLF